jgi:hypothetical protein
VLFPVVLGGDFRSPLLLILLGCFRDLALGDLLGEICGTHRGSLGCDSPPKSVSKGARFWSFPCSWVRGAFGGISLIPLVWTSCGGISLIPIVPKVLFKPVDRFGRSKLGFGGVDTAVLFIPSCPGYTSLTGALERSDRCSPWCVVARLNVWVCLLLSCVGAVSSLGLFVGR